MKLEKPTIRITLDTRRIKSNGKFPARLTITYRRKREYYAINREFTREEFENIMTGRPIKILKDDKLYLDSIIVKATEIISNTKDFSFLKFQTLFFGQQSTKADVYSYFEDYIKKLESEKRIGTAYSYRNAFRSLASFKKKLDFEEITPDWLYRYEAWMLEKGGSKTTIGIYTRSLRTIYNLAIDHKIISKENYPFGLRKYEIPHGQNVKKALPLSDIIRIKNYIPEINIQSETKARDFWLFSYLSNGINFKDIALLKFKNIMGDTLTFERAKTMHSSRSKSLTIKVHLLPEQIAIIEKYRIKDVTPENYIFPILKPRMTPVEEYKCIQQFIKNTNKYMKGIARNLNIELPITTYYARHSYATVLRNSGASVEYISESLGHTTVATTANYLDSFEDDTRKKIASLLLGEPTKKKSKKKSTAV